MIGPDNDALLVEKKKPVRKALKNPGEHFHLGSERFCLSGDFVGEMAVDRLDFLSGDGEPLHQTAEFRLKRFEFGERMYALVRERLGSRRRYLALKLKERLFNRAEGEHARQTGGSKNKENEDEAPENNSGEFHLTQCIGLCSHHAPVSAEAGFGKPPLKDFLALRGLEGNRSRSVRAFLRNERLKSNDGRCLKPAGSIENSAFAVGNPDCVAGIFVLSGERRKLLEVERADGEAGQFAGPGPRLSADVDDALIGSTGCLKARRDPVGCIGSPFLPVPASAVINAVVGNARRVEKRMKAP